VPRPVIDNDELSKLVHINDYDGMSDFHTVVIPCLFPVAAGGEGLRKALEQVRRKATDAIDAGATILVLSDRDADAEMAPIPSLLFTSAVHHHLIREKTRTQVGLVVETARRARCTTCASCSATAPPPSTPTWPSRPSRTASPRTPPSCTIPPRPSPTTSRVPARAC